MKKKLLIITRGDSIGGGTEYLIYLMEMLNTKFDLDIHMTYSLQSIKAYYENRLSFVTFHKVVINRNVNPVLDTVSLSKLIRLINKENFDVVHTNTSKGGIVGRIAARICRVSSVIHTIHGFSFHEHSSKITVSIYSFLERLAAYCCDHIIAVNDFIKVIAIKRHIAPADKIIIIPNGIDPKRVEPDKSRDEIRMDLGIDENDIAVLSIGRLAPQKGFDYLLEAIALMKKESLSKKVHFFIAGDGELKKHLSDKAKKLEINYYLTFLGFRNDTRNLLNACDIVVISSLWEGLSMSLLEAIAAKKAVICTKISANMSVIEDGIDALGIEPKNAKDLNEKIIELIKSDQIRLQLACNAHHKFNSNYTKETMMHKYYNFYKEKVFSGEFVAQKK